MISGFLLKRKFIALIFQKIFSVRIFECRIVGNIEVRYRVVDLVFSGVSNKNKYFTT